jgi:hypothetical protein
VVLEAGAGRRLVRYVFGHGVALVGALFV